MQTAHTEHPAPPTILKSLNYDSFSLIGWNRSITENNVKKLVKENEKEVKMHLFPIIVDSNLSIIDGQHRFETCKRLKLPVYYIIKSGANDHYEEIRSVNTAGRRHTLMEQYMMLLRKGNENAIKVHETALKLPEFLEITVLKTLVEAGNSGSLREKIAEGYLPLHDYDLGFEILTHLSYSDIIGKEKEPFVMAVKELIKANKISPKAFIDKIERHGFVAKSGMGRMMIKEYLKQTYNKNKKQNRL